VATFDNFEQLKDEKTARALIKKALDKVKPAGLKFLYYERFPLGGKDVPLVLVDYGPALQGEIKKQTTKAPSAIGRCIENAAGALAFEAEAGTVRQAALKKFLGTIAGMRAIADAAEAAAPPPDAAPRTVDAPERPAARAATGEAQRRLAVLDRTLAGLPAQQAELFAIQLDKVRTLLAKGEEAGALKLLGQVEALAAKAAAGNNAGVKDLHGVLGASGKAVDAALEKLPADAGSLRDDLLASDAFKAYAALRKNPSGAANAAALTAAGDKLLRHIESQVKLATDWKQHKAQATEALQKAYLAAQQKVGSKEAQARLKAAFEGCSERKAYADAARAASAYRERAAIEKLKASMLARLDEFVQIELRRTRAQELLVELGHVRAPVAPFVARCDAALAKIDADPGPVELSWRSATLTAELGADRTTLDTARSAARALDGEITSALGALGADPPSAAAIAGAEALLKKSLADIDAAEKRSRTNLAKTSPAGREALVRELLDAAKSDPARLLSNDRAGRVGAEAKKSALTRPAVVAAIAAAVTDQQNPPLRVWLKVLQLNAVKGGEIRLANLGSVNLDAHRAKSLHLTLYIANVGAAPPLSAGAAAIIGTLLPDVVDDLGTHVTLEVDGPISKKNPHVFKGEPAGRANALASDATMWNQVRAQMQAKLDGELVRLTGLVQAFIDRGGKLPGD